jgi:hypothetical protein
MLSGALQKQKNKKRRTQNGEQRTKSGEAMGDEGVRGSGVKNR